MPEAVKTYLRPGNTSGENPEAARIVFYPCLDLLRLELAFRFEDVAWLPPFRGALWRGVLGPALKRLDGSGVWQPSIQENLPKSLYDWTFETPASSCLLMPRAGAIPHPLIIDSPAAQEWTFIEPGHTMRIQLTLVGRFTHAWQAIVSAFQDAGQQGIGRAITREGQRGRVRLISVHQVWTHENISIPLWNGENGLLDRQPDIRFVPPPDPAAVHVELTSPMRIKRKNRIIGPGDFGPGDLFIPLMRRCAALMASQGGVYLDMDKARLEEQAKNLVLYNKKLHWRDDKRWSASQKKAVPAGGVTGSLDLDMSQAPELFEFLWLAQWINIGKGAFMGLGNVRLSPL